MVTANEQNDITYLSGTLFEKYSKWGLKITQYLIAGEGEDDIQFENNIAIKACTQYKYLGNIILTQNGITEGNTKNRLTQGRSAINDLNFSLLVKNKTFY